MRHFMVSMGAKEWLPSVTSRDRVWIDFSKTFQHSCGFHFSCCPIISNTPNVARVVRATRIYIQ